jgi:hypothetical protein
VRAVGRGVAPGTDHKNACAIVSLYNPVLVVVVPWDCHKLRDRRTPKHPAGRSPSHGPTGCSLRRVPGDAGTNGFQISTDCWGLIQCGESWKWPCNRCIRVHTGVSLVRFTDALG